MTESIKNVGGRARRMNETFDDFELTGERKIDDFSLFLDDDTFWSGIAER